MMVTNSCMMLVRGYHNYITEIAYQWLSHQNNIMTLSFMNNYNRIISYRRRIMKSRISLTRYHRWLRAALKYNNFCTGTWNDSQWLHSMKLYRVNREKFCNLQMRNNRDIAAFEMIYSTSFAVIRANFYEDDIRYIMAKKRVGLKPHRIEDMKSRRCRMNT